MKTNAARILDQLPEQVFKTLVARGERNGVILAVIPGSSELDLKRLANDSQSVVTPLEV